MRNPSWRWRTIALALLFTAMAGGVLLTTALDRSPGPLKEETQPLLVKTPGEDLLLTEFGDFQCPHCARFALTVVPEIRRELVETGQADYEYRHYPFLGPESYAAAEAAECARDQDAFDRYHDLVYGAVSRGKRPDLRLLLDTATRAELDQEAFEQCLRSGRKRARVVEDKEYGRALGVQGTPSVFLNGQEVDWKNPQDLIEKVREKVRRAGPPGVR